MSGAKTNKRKILNDPVYGFINIQSEIIFDLIEHPYFQRLRRIKQLGLSCLVYPGANHTRFEHALGALHLMRSAIDSLRSKDVEISKHEAEAALCAILLHDIGHGPFSHALEYTLVKGVTHEKLSLLLMEELNQYFEGKLDTAISIFRNQYHKKFLHQLVASQLDMDRLDYLRRDSFFSGVVEGTIGSDRIIKMLNVKNDRLLIDKKGIYSVEKFLIARRLMYWQVYLHKTVIVAEYLLIHVLERAIELTRKGHKLFAPPALVWFLSKQFSPEDLNDTIRKSEMLKNFVKLDDPDILSSIKVWCEHSDPVLSRLSKAIVNRRLLKIEIADGPFNTARIKKIKKQLQESYQMNEQEAKYFVFSDEISNRIYQIDSENIEVLLKDGSSDSLENTTDIDLGAISQIVRKHFLCYPKEFDKD